MTIPTFIDSTVLAADDLLTTLEACRQLRHVSIAAKLEIVHVFFGDIEHSLREGKYLPGTKTFFVHTGSAFEETFSIHGYSCDICGNVSAVPQDRCRYIADSALSGMDGLIKLCLCRVCSNKFSAFCSRVFERDARVPWSVDLEQMMLGFVASEVGIEARRILAGRPPRKRNYESSPAGKDCGNREAITPGCHTTGNLVLGRSEPPNRHEIQEGLRQ